MKYKLWRFCIDSWGERDHSISPILSSRSARCLSSHGFSVHDTLVHKLGHELWRLGLTTSFSQIALSCQLWELTIYLYINEFKDAKPRTGSNQMFIDLSWVDPVHFGDFCWISLIFLFYVERNPVYIYLPQRLCVISNFYPYLLTIYIIDGLF
jgi:hypothetical protein